MSSEAKSKCKFKSKIGGQALIEGIMMRGIDKASMACRLPDGKIDLEVWNIKNGKNAPWFRKVPFIRGSANFIVMLIEGYRCLSKSADKQMADDGEEEMTKFEKWLDDKFGDKLMPILTVIASIIGAILAIGLFVYIPVVIVKLFDDAINSKFLLSLIEGGIKIALFIIYIALMSRMKDIRKTFEYHGAEHKSIFCYEGGEELTVENVKKQSRFHPRCGTSFIIIIFIVGILVFTLVTWSSRLERALIKLALMPIVIGIAYEIIRLAGRYDNPVTRIISAPGLWLQRLTTNEPNDGQMEVAIKALEAVIPDDKEEDRW
ncbi:MAG: DUF1385 domain-containing protein [Oscillospiraceae bacterium]